jgi:hypothetical protein
VDPIKTGDPYLDDAEWNTGRWNPDAHQAKNQKQ